MKASNTLFSHHVEFDAAPGETVRYRCENGLTGGGMVMVLMMGVAYLRVRLTRIRRLARCVRAPSAIFHSFIQHVADGDRRRP